MQTRCAISQIGSILAYIDGGPGSDAVIKTAIEIGRVYGAYVEALHIVTPAETVLPAMDMGGGIVAAAEIFEIMKTESDARKSRAKGALESYCQRAGIKPVEPDAKETLLRNGLTVSWNLFSGSDGRDLARRGRLFDLIVMASAADQIGGVDSVQLESALFDTGRPVLVISGELKIENPAPVVVAWDGSREVAHSVSLALPFLASASRVHLVSIGEREPGTGLKDISRYLLRHGIQAEHSQLTPSDQTIASDLVDTSLALKAGLLVMGAYGHSALGESLFGGVTREMLKAGKISLLMAH